MVQRLQLRDPPRRVPGRSWNCSTRRSGPFVSFLPKLRGVGPDGLRSQLRRVLWSFTRVRSPPRRCSSTATTCRRPSAFPPNHSIVYCPRTHAAFGHPPHPFREFLARGVRVCLGTDSLASNPDLDVLAEARFVRSRYPDFPGDQLLRMVTLSGAERSAGRTSPAAWRRASRRTWSRCRYRTTTRPTRTSLLLGEDAGERRTMFRGPLAPGVSCSVPNCSLRTSHFRPRYE